jgi:ribulose 1,5-bisphosphate synthetase/thiazole synthase
MTEPVRVDVLVVGAGPAGLTAAGDLAGVAGR